MIGFFVGVVYAAVFIWAAFRIILHLEKGKWVLDREDFEV